MTASDDIAPDDAAAPTPALGAVEKVMLDARESASQKKRTLADYERELWCAATEIETSIEAAMRTGLGGAPDAGRMYRAQVLKNASIIFLFLAEREGEFTTFLRSRGFAEWRKSQPAW